MRSRRPVWHVQWTNRKTGTRHSTLLRRELYDREAAVSTVREMFADRIGSVDDVLEEVV